MVHRDRDKFTSIYQHFSAFRESTNHRKPLENNPPSSTRTTAILPIMPKAITCNSATGRPDTTLQTPAKQPQTTQPKNNEEAIPSDAAAGEIEDQPNSSPLYFPPSDPFESEAENEGPTASIPNEGPSVSMAVSEPHPTERGSVAAVTSARKTKYSGHKKSGSNVTLT